jgi:hypothetical protein
MTIIYHEFTVNDTLKPLNCQLQYENSAGVMVNMILTGLTVKFKMVDNSGLVVVNEESATIIDAANGIVQFDFIPGNVDTPGTYWGWFIVLGGVGGIERDTYPIGRKLCIIIKQAA